jgi:hypothetical protein
MNRAPWVALAYGYMVALISVIVFLIGMFNFVDAAFDRANPLQNAYGPFGGNLSSFEAFRVTQQMDRPPSRAVLTATPGPGDTLSTAEQRRQYEAIRAGQIAQTKYSASKRMVTHGFLLLVAAVLFATHWRWIRQQREAPKTA